MGISETYWHPVALHRAQLFFILREPALGLEFIRIFTKNRRISMSNPTVDANNSLHQISNTYAHSWKSRPVTCPCREETVTYFRTAFWHYALERKPSRG